MDADARLMLGSTVDNNSGIDALDAYLYDPARHASTLRRPLNSFLVFEQDIRAGSHDRALSHELLSPWLNPVILRGEPGHISGATLALEGNTAYIADFDFDDEPSRFVVADLSAPESPQILGTTTISGHSLSDFSGSAKIGTNVWLSGFGFSSGPAGGVFSVDVSDPALPQYEPITRIEGPARSLHARGEQLLGIFDTELRIYDVSDAVAPVILGSYQHAGGQCRQAASLGAHSYLLCGSDLITLETSDPANLQIASVTTLGVTTLVRSSIAIDGATLVINQGLIPATLRVFDVSNPASPTELGRVTADNVGTAFNLRLHRGMAYLGSFDQRLMVFDLRMPGAYSYLGNWRSIGSSLRNLTIIEERVVGVGASTYAAIDTSAPLTPPESLAGLGALKTLFATKIATLPDSSTQQGIAFVLAIPNTLALDTTSRSQVATTFAFASDQTSGDGYVATFANFFENDSEVAVSDLRLTPFAANGPRVDSAVFDMATTLRLSDNTGTSIDALNDTTVIGTSSGVLVVSTPGSNLAAANELAATDLGRTINRVAQFDARDSTGASNRYVAMLAGNTSGLDDLLIRRIAANGQTTPVASIRIGAATEACTLALSVKRDGPNALYVGCPRSLVRVDLTKLSNPSVQARLRMVRSARDIQPLPQPSNLPALYRSADILLVAEFATGLRIVDASGTSLETLDIIQTLSNSSTTAISRTSPLELLSGESVGVLPLAAPYYPQVR